MKGLEGALFESLNFMVENKAGARKAKMKRFLPQIIAVGLVFTMVFAFTSIAKASNNNNQNNHDNQQVTICHRTDDVQKPYHQETVSADSVDGNSGNDHGQGDHLLEHTGPLASSQAVAQALKDSHTKWGDIIPPFDTNNHSYDNPQTSLNWPAGEAIWNNDCNVPPVDLCTNLPGNQVTMPQGYEDPDHDKICTEIPVDLCCNLDGIQTEIPQGYEDPNHDGICTPIQETDVCPNLDGIQSEVPQGYVLKDGLCVQEEEDLCSNIEGIQTEVPEGYTRDPDTNTCSLIPTSPSPSAAGGTTTNIHKPKVTPQVLGTVAPSAQPLPVSGADVNYNWIYYFLIIGSLMLTYYLKVRGWQKIKI